MDKKYREPKTIRIFKEGTRPKNAIRIGDINKKLYVVSMSKIDNEYVKVIHNLKTKQDDVVEYVDGEVADILFSKMIFY